MSELRILSQCHPYLGTSVFNGNQAIPVKVFLPEQRIHGGLHRQNKGLIRGGIASFTSMAEV